MNRTHKEKIKRSSEYVKVALSLMRLVHDDKQDSLDATPDNLRGGSRYEKRERAVDYMHKAIEDLEHADEMITEVL